MKLVMDFGIVLVISLGLMGVSAKAQTSDDEDKEGQCSTWRQALSMAESFCPTGNAYACASIPKAKSELARLGCDAELGLPTPPQQLPLTRGYAPQMNQTPTPGRVPPQLVNECISIRLNDRGIRSLYNGCAFTVQVSWCVEDREASAACRNGANGTMSDSIAAGKDTVSFIGRTGRVFWTACKGGLGVLPSLKQGQSSCS